MQKSTPARLTQNLLTGNTDVRSLRGFTDAVVDVLQHVSSFGRHRLVEAEDAARREVVATRAVEVAHHADAVLGRSVYCSRRTCTCTYTYM